MSNPAPDAPDPKIALERYRNVIGYLQYENNTFWVRSGFMLVAHSALLGFLTKILPEPTSSAASMNIVLSLGIGIVGLILSFLWTGVIQGALWWIERWHSILLSLEPEAYGTVEVFRGAVGDRSQEERHRSTRGAARRVALLFRIAWIVAVIYTTYVAALKWAGC
jgi:hypothetical protein